MKRRKKRREKTGGAWEAQEWTFESTIRARRSGGLRLWRRRKKRAPARRTYAGIAGARTLRGPLVIPSRTQLKALVPRLPGILSLAFWLWMLFWVSLSDAYYVPQVQVQGNRVVPTAQVAAQAGIPSGYHIFFVDPDLVRERVLALPAIREAWVECHLPGRITIRVAEREPVLNWRAGGKAFWVDREGVLLPADTPLPDALTVVENEAGRKVGERVHADVLEALDQLGQLLPSVRQYHYQAEMGVGFEVDGIRVFLGTENLGQRVHMLQQLLKELQTQDRTPTEIHVEYDHPVIRW